MSKLIQAVKGMNDILPDQSYKWEFFESVVRDWLRDFGYKNIRTPIVESTDLFVRSIGEVTDIVEKEMYSFEDSLNGDQLTLRPEGTASCLRAALQNGLLYNQSQRLWYMGPMFRHERPQKGRYRQFHQLGIEALGFAGPDIDAEMLIMTAELWRRLGLSKLELQINTLGTAAERANYREVLIKYLEQHVEVLDADGKRRLYSNPLRVLDSKTPAMQSVIAAAPLLMDYVGEASKTHFAALQALLAAVGVDYSINPRLVRGLDYYNGTVFEWVSQELGAQGTVCAGGRYDGLVEQLGGKATAAFGCAMGIERLLLLLESQNIAIPDRAPDIYLVKSGPATDGYALQIAAETRAAGYAVLMHCGDASLKSQMKKADASQAKVALIVAENEYQAATVVLKPLRQQLEQETCARQDVVARLHEMIGGI